MHGDSLAYMVHACFIVCRVVQRSSSSSVLALTVCDHILAAVHACVYVVVTLRNGLAVLACMQTSLCSWILGTRCSSTCVGRAFRHACLLLCDTRVKLWPPRHSVLSSRSLPTPPRRSLPCALPLPRRARGHARLTRGVGLSQLHVRCFLCGAGAGELPVCVFLLPVRGRGSRSVLPEGTLLLLLHTTVHTESQG